ncbi:MAG: oligopeptide/dipeptide ABC transporter ATP-binding protein [Pseudonocardiaceae bacterium]
MGDSYSSKRARSRCAGGAGARSGSFFRALLSAVPRLDPADRPQRQILTGETPDPASIPAGCRFHPRCPIVQPRCREIDPELRRPDAATAQHRAACILV